MNLKFHGSNICYKHLITKEQANKMEEIKEKFVSDKQKGLSYFYKDKYHLLMNRMYLVF